MSCNNFKFPVTISFIYYNIIIIQMETIIRNTRKLGTSAGVLLPKSWENSLVKVERILSPDNIELLKLIKDEIDLKDVLGVYLVGSYARDDYDENSDVDILVITNNINKNVKKGVYELTILSMDNLEEQLENNCLPVLAWIKEAKTIINSSLIEKYKNTKINLKNLKWHIETTKTIIDVIKETIKLAEEESDLSYLESCAYSLVLRIRTLYIIECLKNNKVWTKNELRKMIKKISGSDSHYNVYENVKGKKENKIILTVIETKRLLDYLINKNKKVEKWLKEKRD